DTALVVAVLVPLVAFAAQTGTLDLLAVLSTLPAAAAMFVMMLAVEYPDVEADGASGKRNLVVRLGRSRARGLVVGGLVATAAGVVLALAGGAPLTVIPLALLAVPAGLGLRSSLANGSWRLPAGNAEIAARGVTYFFMVSLASLLGYLTAER
ncbi:MAG: UbiA family prenyltransferase, partial [Candidatus Eremiobacteraeota bacterium]|nr:UbiA family prenyltransferase [Candidatus Eremiobacteraeota bacterium]